ncbi:hydrolase [Rhodanobacter thiooxydans]|uniref:Hydrolase n=1 Tax=Rhodanobacter thiooxydans TaxID=416169 RepID=A0A154QLF7_9GAMM|nr:isochorismatase family protein [Rhodanobacter thiooxydans]EIM01243.1 isochorismatase family protein [Rhodanobacter thiooxydans LCS2]KZC24588.1 hydrolase [Rhodanobacter thiooxydans]
MSKLPAVLVIDVQQSFLHAPYWREDDVPAFRKNLVRLLDAAAARGRPIVRILHEENDGHFGAASGLVRPMAWVPEAHDVVFHKRVHNAFTDTGLQAWLRGRGVERVIVSGIRTEQCCETTARVASDLGFAVDYVTEATLTFPMVHAGSGTRYDAQDIKQRTELVLDGRFARIRTVDDVLADH